MAASLGGGAPFMNDGDECNHLNDVVCAHLESGDSCPKATIDRFEELLNRRGRDDGSIMLQDHWAVLLEYQGDFRKAIWHRRREAQLIELAFSLGGPIGPIDHEYLAKVLRLLASDLDRVGEQSEAAEVAKRADEIAGSA